MKNFIAIAGLGLNGMLTADIQKRRPGNPVLKSDCQLMKYRKKRKNLNRISAKSRRKNR